MHLAALSHGVGVAGSDFAGSVAAVFPRACLLAVGDSLLLTLVTRETGNLPGGIVLATPPGFSFEEHVAVGDAAAVRGGVLRLGGSRLGVDLRAARPWRSRLADIALDPARAGVRACLECAAGVLDRNGRAGPLAAMAGDALARPGQAAGRRDPDAASPAVSRLIGLGDGATPAGDDYLVGYLAGLWATVGASGSVGAIESLGRAIDASLHCTSLASQIYLRWAIVGEVSERLTDLAAAIARGDEALTAAAASAALAVGHSSGACGVLGLLDGIAAMAPCSGRECPSLGHGAQELGMSVPGVLPLAD